MPCPHFKIKISTRSKSPPTTASAAYQSGERLYDERTHRTKDYNDKRGVIYSLERCREVRNQLECTDGEEAAYRSSQRASS